MSNKGELKEINMQWINQWWDFYIYFWAKLKFSLCMSLKDIWCRSPPKIINSSFSITEQCPSLAHGFLPMTKFELFSRGARNFEWVYFPNSVSLSGFGFPLGFPITSSEFFIACDVVYSKMYRSFSFSSTSKFFSISAFFW